MQADWRYSVAKSIAIYLSKTVYTNTLQQSYASHKELLVKVIVKHKNGFWYTEKNVYNFFFDNFFFKLPEILLKIYLKKVI